MPFSDGEGFGRGFEGVRNLLG
jgi:hypothetical protein